MEITQHWYGKLVSVDNGVSDCHGAPCWFTKRMLDAGKYAVVTNSGLWLLIKKVLNVTIDAGGNLWIDVEMMGQNQGQNVINDLKAHYGNDYAPQCLYAAGNERTATINAEDIQFALEI